MGAIVRTGDVAAPLVILPGLLSDSRLFADQLAEFDGIVVDGFYGTAGSVSAMAAFALDRMPARASLLGHSMGARIALEIWRQAPARVARLALADTGVHPVRTGEQDHRYRLRDLGRANGIAALADAWLPPMIGPARRGDPELTDALRAMTVAAGMATFERQTEALLHRPDAAAVLPTITCPTLVIVGRDDSWAPVEQHAAIAAAIPGARLRVIGDAGHMAPAEAPQAFNDALREWLAWPA